MKITQKEDVRTGSCGGHDIDSISIVWIEILEKKTVEWNLNSIEFNCDKNELSKLILNYFVPSDFQFFMLFKWK